jgi:hypothetical protein
MRSNLIDGKIPPPISRTAAEARREQLLYEATSLESTLLSGVRRAKYASDREYAAWVKRSRAALGFMREEARQLGEWLEPKAQSSSIDDEERQFAEFWRE